VKYSIGWGERPCMHQSSRLILQYTAGSAYDRAIIAGGLCIFSDFCRNLAGRQSIAGTTIDGRRFYRASRQPRIQRRSDKLSGDMGGSQRCV
jgi:hypothetical protein